VNCPVCGKEMVEEDFGGIKVDVCKDGCKGLWFDMLQLPKLDEDHKGFGESLEEALKHPRVAVESQRSIKCPKCNIPMQSHEYKRLKDVDIDECYKCGGVFLDAGKLKAIRDSMSFAKIHRKIKEDQLKKSEEFEAAVKTLEMTPHKMPSALFKFLSLRPFRKRNWDK